MNLPLQQVTVARQASRYKRASGNEVGGKLRGGMDNKDAAGRGLGGPASGSVMQTEEIRGCWQSPGSGQESEMTGIPSHRY